MPDQFTGRVDTVREPGTMRIIRRLWLMIARGSYILVGMEYLE